MSHPQIAFFARLADGNAAPVRAVAGQKALLARTSHGSAYHPERDEFMIANFYAQAVQIYRGDSDGDVAPVRIIQNTARAPKNNSCSCTMTWVRS